MLEVFGGGTGAARQNGDRELGQGGIQPKKSSWSRARNQAVTLGTGTAG